MSINFVVEGEPRPKQSFRYAKGGGYTPASVKAWQEAVAWEAKIAMKGEDLLTGWLKVTLLFMLGNNRRVDIDNLSKCVLDAMNGIVYEDDTKISQLDLEKMTSHEKPGVIVIVDMLET